MKWFFRHRILSLSLITVILMLLAISLDVIFRYNNQPKNVVKRIEKELEAKEKIVEGYFDQIEKQFPLHFDTHLTHEGFIDLYQKKGIELLVYDNDTIKFWSDNFIPVPHIFDYDIFGRQILHLKNGWYRVLVRNTPNMKFVGMILIKMDYSYQNEYLTNTFQKDFLVAKSVEIIDEPGEFIVKTVNGDDLIALKFPNYFQLEHKQAMILFILYLAALLFFMSLLLQFYLKFLTFIKSRLLLVGAFIIDVILIRGLLFYFKIPGTLYNTELFSPAYYGSSIILPSLGDLLINAFLVLFVAYAIFIVVKRDRKTNERSLLFRYIISFILFIISIFLFDAMIYLWKGLVIDSNISLNLNNIFSLTLPSILGFIVIATLILSYYLITDKISRIIQNYIKSPAAFFIMLILALMVYGSISILIYRNDEFTFLIFLFFYLSSFWFVSRRNLPQVSFYRVIIYLVLFALITTYTIHRYNVIKEKEERTLMAVKLSADRDELAEYMFSDVVEKILTDQALIGSLDQALMDEEEETKMDEYIVQNYFGFYRSKYNFQLTLCDRNRNLVVQPDNFIVGCHDFFNDIILETGKPTATKELYFLDDGTDDLNYLAIIRFPLDSVNIHREINLYIELYSKYVPRALGYPELLIDKKARDFADISNYSYAIYSDSVLLKSVGSYGYSIEEPLIETIGGEFTFVNSDHYNHLVYPVDETTHLVVSLENEDFADIVAPFSYLIIFFGLYLLVFLLVSYFPFHPTKFEVNFKSRMQISIIAIILVSFLLIGIASSFYIMKLNDDKNLDILSEKAHSVLIELEHKLADVSTIDPEMSDYLEGLLTKFSQVFFSDINLFDLNGQLIASSRPEIFEEGLISTLMDANAYEQIAQYNRTLFIHEEKIGNYEYLSAYVPFRNEDNQLMAYLNLPYFAKQTELRSELSTFLIAFTNIYIILIAIAIFVTLIISNYITLPLQIIKEKISKLKFGKPNEKIDWVRKDEIGQLIIEYNRMIDELSRSADLLAKSERESAWREMAKQVAHEIKNPLTPMKLSIQYLQKAWDDKAPDWDQRLKRFSQTVIQQIDNLSAIASEFSDFAKMPQSEMERIDLATVIENAIGLFKDVQQIDFVSNAKQQAPCYVYADKKQMLRVFNNLIKNSMQAIKNPSEGRIEIDIHKENDSYKVTLTDNGFGISKTEAEKIFTPSFTTKTGGMGLGLAIVQSIIESTGGKIWFESEPGTGTSFYILLPQSRKIN